MKELIGPATPFSRITLVIAKQQRRKHQSMLSTHCIYEKSLAQQGHKGDRNTDPYEIVMQKGQKASRSRKFRQNNHPFISD
jgi:hypothetical protein